MTRICSQSKPTLAVRFGIDRAGEDEDLVMNDSEDQDLDLQMNDDDNDDDEKVRKPRKRLLQKNSAKNRDKQSSRQEA